MGIGVALGGPAGGSDAGNGEGRASKAAGRGCRAEIPARMRGDFGRYLAVLGAARAVRSASRPPLTTVDTVRFGPFERSAGMGLRQARPFEGVVGGDCESRHGGPQFGGDRSNKFHFAMFR